MSLFEDMALVADRLLDEFGDVVTLGHQSQSGDPWAAAVTVSQSQILAAIVPVSTEMRAGGVEADAVLYARPAGPIAIGDTITRGAETYRVTKSRAYKGNGVTALIEAELVWAS